MTCALTTTTRIRSAEPSADREGSVAATEILDLGHVHVRAAAEGIEPGDALHVVRAAHAWTQTHVRPVYSMAEFQSASLTIRKGRGSCSQRLAVVEAIARACGIATRSRGLLVDGEFWYRRFRGLTFFVPETILVAWPEFLLDGEWIGISRLFSAGAEAAAFDNVGVDTLFDAIGRGVVAVDHHGPACDCDDDAWGSRIRRDLGAFESRDSLFERYGTNLPAPLRVAIEPVFGRWAAGGRPRVSAQPA